MAAHTNLTGQGDEQGAPKGNGARDRVTYSCGGCSARWSGVSRAHCSACHETFAGAAFFDRHRRNRGEEGYCLHPSEISKPDMYLVSGLWTSVEEMAPRLAPAQRARG